jgi:hypothetical protein
VAGFRDGERTVDRSTTMSHRGSGNRESGGCVLIDIANRVPRHRKPRCLTSKTHSKCWMSKTGGKPGPERARLTSQVTSRRFPAH